MAEIVLRVPGRDEPGYLRRMRAALEIQERLMRGDGGPALVDALVEFLLPYVSEPEDRETAREALLDASQTQFDDMVRAVSGGGQETSRPFSVT